MVQQGGIKNIFDTYRLEDPEGKEITISQLIDTYLSDPDTCFKADWPELEPLDLRFQRERQPRNITYAAQILRNHLHNV